MGVFLFDLKKQENKIKYVSLISVTLVLFIVVLQSQALLFNPLIIALCNTLCLFPPFFSFASLGIISIVGLFININYGIELIFLFSISLLTSFILRKLIKDMEHKIIPFSSSIILGIIYCFLAKTPSDYINLCTSFLTSILLSYLLIYSVNKLLKQQNNTFSLSFILVFLTLSFSGLNSLSIFFIMLSFYLYMKLNFYNEVLISLFPSVVGIYIFNNFPFQILLIPYVAFFITSLLKKNKYNEIISGLIFVIILFIYDQKAYLLKELYEGIGAALISYLLPIKGKTNTTEININDKLNEIISFCTLLEDKRFSKYNDLDKLLSNDLKKCICDKCPSKDNCHLIDEKVISNYIDEEKKKSIISNCLYSYQIMKKISIRNQMYYEFNNNQTILYEHNKNLLKPFSLIKKMASNNVAYDKITPKFELEYEIISKGFSAENGDSYEIFIFGNYTYLLLSDGMGHTKESNEISSYLVTLIKSLIPYEDNIFSLIKDVNKIMLSKTCEEVYATLDIARFNLIEGKAQLFKMGSYSSFFIRNKVYKEYPPLLPPIGIVHTVKEKEETISFNKGDIFIFMTDGFGENANELISSTIQKSSFLNIHNYTRFLYNKLKLNDCNDDKTIIGIKIR